MRLKRVKQKQFSMINIMTEKSHLKRAKNRYITK